MRVGDIVWDDLTQTKACVERVTEDERGNVGIWLDNDYLEGGRHPWEVSEYPLPSKESSMEEKPDDK